jgi:phosphoribosylaminoimidazole carboxylase (NCAIR synthetase)
MESTRSKSSRICYLSASDDAVAEKARAIALHVSEKFNHVGLLAEMFQTEDDEILVNEVAPRPHNSGHYSIGQVILLSLKTTLELF